MNQVRIGSFLLIFLLALGLFVQGKMEAIHRPTARLLLGASEEALQEHWDEAHDLSQQAQEAWRRRWRFSAALADHQPMEEIDGLFARLTAADHFRDTQEYAATCRELARRIQAMADAHTLHWWNLL